MPRSDDPSSISIGQAVELLKNESPSIVYLSGKTCTGKSTLAHQLHEYLSYDEIELDAVVSSAVIEPLGLGNRGGVFVEVYRQRTQLEWIYRFVVATHARLTENKHRRSRSVVEGAIANVETLLEVFAPFDEWLCVYLHPVDPDRYARNIRTRFQGATADSRAGLPSRFWNYIDQHEFIVFCETGVITDSLNDSILAYASASMKESADRFNAIRAAIPKALLVHV